MITVLVHTRHPGRSLRRFRPAGMVTLLGVLAATPMMYLAQSVLSVLLMLDILGLGWSVFDATPVAALATVTSLAATALNVAMTFLAAALRRISYRHLACLLPGYWVLYWVAAWRALRQVIQVPFLWEKTAHGQGH